jgi:hypothetical protein
MKRRKQSDNPYDTYEFREWADRMRTRLIPKMADSGSILMIAPNVNEKFDIEFALQIGASILLEKPLILLAHTGRQIPSKLRAIADKIIEVNLDETTMDSPDIQRQLAEAFKEFSKQ